MILRAETTLRGSLDMLKEVERKVEDASYDLHAKQIILNNIQANQLQADKIDEKILLEKKEANLLANERRKRVFIKTKN